MYFFLVILLVLASVALIGVVLIQSGKGDGLSGAFGMGEGQAVFGSRAGDVLTKATSWFAIAFMLLSLAVTYVSKHASDSMLPGTRSNYTPSGRAEKHTSLADYEKKLSSSGDVESAESEGSTSAVPENADANVKPTAATNATAKRKGTVAPSATSTAAAASPVTPVATNK